MKPAPSDRSVLDAALAQALARALVAEIRAEAGRHADHKKPETDKAA